MKPAYTDIRVLYSVYVSSSGHYCATVRYTHQRRRHTRDVTLPGLGLLYKVGLGEVNVPRYVRREIARQVVEVMESGRAHFYEYDRDGNKRFDGLRYHAQENVEWILKCLKETGS